MRINEIYSQPRLLLSEATYKEINSLIDPEFLDTKNKSKSVPTVNLIGIDHDTLRFRTGLTKSGNQYLNMFRFVQWDDVTRDKDLSPSDAAKLLLWSGDVELHCSCPAFKYWGYQYLLTAIGSSMVHEKRKPIIRNPMERGICCKHLVASLKLLPFHSGDIAKEIAKQRR